MKTFSTEPNSDDEDNENTDGSSLENQGRPAVKFEVRFFFHRSDSTDMIGAANSFCEKFGANGKKSIVAQSR